MTRLVTLKQTMWLAEVAVGMWFFSRASRSNGFAVWAVPSLALIEDNSIVPL